MSESHVTLTPPYPLSYEGFLRRALEEDLGRAGDLTTDAIVSPGTVTTASLAARANGRLAGMAIAMATFRMLDPNVEVEILLSDGKDAQKGQKVAILNGLARPILSAERTALNLLGKLSGIATATRDIVAAVGSFSAKVVSTRKTTPGLRALQNYAVRVGGGASHRYGLDDAVLIKDNHRIIAGSVTEAIRRARRYVGHMIKIEVELDTLAELQEVLDLGVDAVLLDNMSLENIARAVCIIKGKAITEASGGITLKTAKAIAATGVDLMSVGWITHSAPQLDIGLDLESP